MDSVELIINIALVVGFAYVGWKLVKWFRAQLSDNDVDGETGEAGFTLNALRELHRAGKLSAEEYEKLKVVVIAAAKKAADRIAAQIAQRAAELEQKKKKRKPFVPP
jgi:hypothetical protein